MLGTLFRASKRYFSYKLPCSLGALTEPKCPPPTCRLAPSAGHDLLRHHHRGNGDRRPPGWAARADAVPTRRSELLSSPSQKGDTADPMRRARPNQSRKRSRTRFCARDSRTSISVSPISAFPRHGREPPQDEKPHPQVRRGCRDSRLAAVLLT